MTNMPRRRRAKTVRAFAAVAAIYLALLSVACGSREGASEDRSHA